MLAVYVNAVLFIHPLASLDHGDALGAVVCSHFANQHGSNNSIFIPYIGACQIAVTLLETEDVAVLLALLFQEADLFADKLEAGEHIDDFYAVCLGDGVDNISSNDGLDSDGVLRHGTHLCSLLTDVFQQHCANLVAGEQRIVIPVRNGNAHTVCVRVGCQQQVRLYLTAELQTAFQRFTNLRIRIGTGGEVAVRIFLFRNNSNVLNADGGENVSNRLVAGV